jgi:type IV secretory pathway TrbL component
MKLSVKAFLLQFGSFAVLFLLFRFLIYRYSNIEENLWASLIAFVVATILAPKFKNIKTEHGEKIYVKWFLFKTVREL